MKKIILLFMGFVLINNAWAQNSLGKSDDQARIIISSYVPDQVEGISDITMQSLSNKLDQITTSAGMGGTDSRFIITPVVSVLNKEVTATAPTMIALSLNITFYIGDGLDGTKFSSYSINAKGVGATETKAYLMAFKNIKTNDPGFATLIEKGKTKIIEYYNSRCDFLIKQAQTTASQDKYDEAIYSLTQVPEICKDCYMKSMDAVAPIYKAKAEKQCKILLTKAKSIWASGQDVNAANMVADALGQIDPNTSCYAEANKLVQEVGKRVKDLDQREWNFKLKEQQDDVDIRMATIKAARDVGVAYGKGQPKVIYKTALIRTWY
jgi:hypothetical protein